MCLIHLKEGTPKKKIIVSVPNHTIIIVILALYVVIRQSFLWYHILLTVALLYS